MVPSRSARAYPGIDLLRALAALLVLAYHVVEYGQWAAVPNTGLGYVVRHGWVGVDLFLTISGFVIALSALDGVARDGAGFRWPFARRRLARIAPLYLLTCAAFLVLVVPGMLLLPAKILVVHIGAHLLFIHNLSPATHGSINGPTWSVALEMQFYVFMLLAGPWLARARARWFLLGAVAVALAWRFATTLALEPGSAEPILQFVYAVQLPGVIDEFALGIALAMIVHRGRGPLLAWLAPGWRNCAAWVAVAAALLAIAIELDQNAFMWSNRWMIVGWRTLLAAGFVALIAAAMTFPLAGHWALAPARYLGDISYGIYLWHMLVLIALVGSLPGLGGADLLVAAAGGTLVLAMITWHLLEKPNMQKTRGAVRAATAPAGGDRADVARSATASAG